MDRTAYTQAQQLFGLISAPIQWKIIELAFQKQLFDHLAQPVSAGVVAQQLALNETAVRLWLDALCSLGLLIKHDSLYRAQVDLEPLLISSAKDYLGDSLLHIASTRHAGLQQLEQLLQGEKATTNLQLDDPDFWKLSQTSLWDYHRIISAQEQLLLLCDLPQWPVITDILDLGAGSEALALEILSNYPNKKVNLFDLPACIEQIKRRQQPLKKGLQLITGDYNNFQLEGEFDLIWCSLSLYYAKDLPALFAKLYQQLRPGGLFVSFHEGLSAERTVPKEHIIGRLLPALQGNDLSFNRGQISELMQKAGFICLQSYEAETLFGPICVDIAEVRK